MKKFIKFSSVVVILYFCVITAIAQQQTRFTQFMWNEYLINPAYTGGLAYNPVQLTYRKQWQGFNGSPETFTFGGHTALNAKMGLGAMVFKDNMGGAITQTGIMLNYAYRVRLNKQSNLSFGLSAIINQFAFDNTKINALNANDPSFQGGIQKSTAPDAMFGILYKYKQKLNIGFSSSQLVQSKLKNLNDVPGANNRLIRHYNAQVSYHFIVNDKFNIEPAVLLKATEVTPMQVDVNVRAWYQNLLMLGFTYRHQDAVAALLGVKYKNMFVGYSYDMSTSAIQSYNNGSHEIVMGYHFAAKTTDSDKDGVLDHKDKCPDAAGPKENNGCPWGDTDNDGVADNIDKCPDAAGPKENNGCPWGDKDNDGVADNIDKCPDALGPKENNGCPWGDKDNDGVADNIDQCPDMAGTKEDNGCPPKDTDKDGIIDKYDNCPRTMGDASNGGCPIVSDNQKSIISKAISNLEFENNSANITKGSYMALDMLAILLSEKSDWKMRIAGHTDNVGNDEFNMNLSKQRSEAVRDYLTKKGIDASRIMAEYYGETRPIAPNDTPQGREKNRRVEMTFVFD
jgi:type IX secretion system PorP/SprF family membrane protein